ncbi:MAG: rod shape-determining protein RodA [Alistipes sp.]|jgi:rod shape determining protein RodA|nr:rod shape-determining protein RodA [Alistipes sp.]
MTELIRENSVSGWVRGGNKERVLGRGVDWWTIGVWLALVVMGWVNLYAAVYDETQGAFELGLDYGKQLMWIGASMLVALLVMLLDDKYYHILAWPIYGLCLAAMLSTIVLGREINGAKAWLVLGPLSIQPTEFMKFAVSLALARHMSGYGFTLGRWRGLWRVGAIVGLPVAVMFMQHDVGSAVVYGSFMLMLYREGLNRWIYIVSGIVLGLFFGSFWITDTGLLMAILVGCAAGFGFIHRNWRAPLVWLASVALVSIVVWTGARFALDVGWSYYYVLLAVSCLAVAVAAIAARAARIGRFWVLVVLFFSSLAFVSASGVVFDSLDLHQQKRILDTLGVESDARGWGYNVNQSKIAIGSGGLLGKGFLEGTQTKFDFVPEQSTDFIFCTVGEEWGFAGSIAVLALFCVLIMRLVKMGERCQEPFARIYCYCVAGIFLVHVLINTGMTIGLVPVIGIPLPFFSYGGSSFLAFTLLLFVALRLDYGAGEEIER